ncbi:MAG: N-acetyltransferase [Acidimicrobiia bacterium]
MEIVTFASRPDLDIEPSSLSASWPRFMLEDPVAYLYYSFLEEWSEHVLVGLIDGRVVARAMTVAFAMNAENRSDLPASGWDGIVRWAHFDRLTGVTPTHVSALEVVVAADMKGTGMATPMVEAMRTNVDRLGFNQFVAPVRPSQKHTVPHEPMQQYVNRMRPDGLPEDPWMRIHARLGAEILSVCPTSMTIPGTIDQWADWTGSRFEQSGDVEVPGALVPVHVDLEQDHAVYVEPNVWMRHSW